MQIKQTGNLSWTTLILVSATVFPVNATLAQAKPIQGVTQMPETTKTPSKPGYMATTSAPLLSSPFLSPAAKERLRQKMITEDQAYALVKTGDDLAKSGDWQHAQGQYQQALDLSPNAGLGRQLALYGLIACCRTTGDMAKGLSYSRQAIYHNGSATDGFYENDTAKLTQFALLLNQVGQTVEAVQVYNRAAHSLDYRDSAYNGGKPYLDVLLPEVAMGNSMPGQVKYTPEHLQALADTLLAYTQGGFWTEEEVMAHIQEAVKLYPESPVTHYYLGGIISAKDRAGAKAAYQKAAELGDDKTVAAAKERLTMMR